MFSVEKTDLFNILKRTKGVLVKHSIQPVLGCYKIDVANNAIKVTATDLDNQISGSCVARTEEDLSFCVDGFKFTEIVNILDGIITFEVEDGKLLIKCGRTKYKMLMKCNYGHEFEMNFSNFKQGKRCPICSYKKRRLTQKEVYNKMIEKGYELLSKRIASFLNNL